MDISINLSDIQVGKRYVLEFCLTEDGSVVKKSTSSSPKREKSPTKSSSPSIDDFESKDIPSGPTLGNPAPINKEYKIETSFDGKLKPEDK